MEEMRMSNRFRTEWVVVSIFLCMGMVNAPSGASEVLGAAAWINLEEKEETGYE